MKSITAKTLSQPELAMASDCSHQPVTVIEPLGRWNFVDLQELWRYRELLFILAMRDVKVRYKQTLVGAAWAILQPLLTMVVFTTLFSLLGRWPTEGTLPYAVTLYCGLLPWQFFASAIVQSSESLVANRSLVTKIYFPRVIIPMAPVMAALVDFCIAFGILAGLMCWYGIVPGWQILLLPVFVALAISSAISIGIWLSALNSPYRDLRHAIPFLVQLGFFVSPVVYDTKALIPQRFQFLYSLNPMVGVLEGFRWALLGKTEPPILPMLVSTVFILLLFTTGFIAFRRVESSLADRI